MSLTDLITIRLPAGKRFLYEREATHKGQTLGVYLRELLERGETSPHNLPENAAPSPSHDQGVLLEILLLLRCLASPEKMLLVQKELNRLKIPVWEGESFPRKSQNAT